MKLGFLFIIICFEMSDAYVIIKERVEQYQCMKLNGMYTAQEHSLSSKRKMAQVACLCF